MDLNKTLPRLQKFTVHWGHRWTIHIVLYWKTIPKAGIVLVLVDFTELSNNNTKAIPNKNSG